MAPADRRHFSLVTREGTLLTPEPDEQTASTRWRIVVIDDHAPSRTLVGTTVAALGGAVVGEATEAAGSLELVDHLRPDAVVLAVGLPDADGVELAHVIMGRAPCPIVLLTSRTGPAVIRRARRAGAMAWLVKPLRTEELEPTIELAIARFAELSQVQQENAALRRALEDRKRIERAKGLLTERYGLTEAQAFRAIQKTAMDRRISMARVAEEVIRGDTLPSSA
jgi:AmiR/NasT family two-component response regulator